MAGQLIQTLQELAPQIATADPADLPAVLGLLERLRAEIWMKIPSAQTAVKAAPPAEPTHYLTVEEVAQRFHVTPKWLYRHKGKMPHSQPSRKVLLFPETAVEKWFASRKT